MKTGGLALRRFGFFIVVALGCTSSKPRTLKGDAVLGLHVGMKRRALSQAFSPTGEGKWAAFESVAGEGRLRWIGTSETTVPVSLDVQLGPGGVVRELVFTMRAADARAALGALGADPPSGLTTYQMPSGTLVVAPGLGTWTLRMASR
jgi:hypothetical protein